MDEIQERNIDKIEMLKKRKEKLVAQLLKFQDAKKYKQKQKIKDGNYIFFRLIGFFYRQCWLLAQFFSLLP